jgi:hypothetical protein
VCPDRQGRLQPVEIRQPVGIGLVGPGQPEFLDTVAELRVLDQRRGLDPVAHQVGGIGLAGIGRVAVGDHQLPRPGQQPRPARGDQRVDVREYPKLCVSDRAHAVFRYVQASKRPANIMAS